MNIRRRGSPLLSRSAPSDGDRLPSNISENPEDALWAVSNDINTARRLIADARVDVEGVKV